MSLTNLSKRHLGTILFLLRNHAARQRFEHGPMVENPGALELTPTEMETWADEIEAEHASALPEKSPYSGLIQENCCADALPDNSEDSWLTT